MTSSSLALSRRNCIAGWRLLLLVFFLSGNVYGFFDPYIDMFPTDPIGEIGGRLELTCTILSKYPGPYNSSHIYFKHNNRNYTSHAELPDITVTPINRTSSVLTLSNVTSDTYGHHYCYLPDVTGIRNSGSQNVKVMRRPIKPVVTSCEVRNREILKCRWTPTTEEQKNYTSTKPRYRFEWIVDDEEVWHSCSISDRNSDVSQSQSQCTIVDEQIAVISSSFVGNERFCVRLNVENDLQINIVSEPWCSNVSSIVILDPPTIGPCSVNESHVSIRWVQPSPTLIQTLGISELEYKVQIKSQWIAQPTEVRVHDVTSYTQESTPFTNYSMRVSIKPPNFGLWSSFSNCSVVSPPAAPRLSPSTTLAAFHAPKGAFPKKYTFYWKPVQQQYYNGREFKYCLLKRPSNSIDWQRLNEVEARKSSYDFYADRHESEYQYAAVSCNLKGQTVPTVIWQFNPDLVNAIENFAFERNGKKVSAYWRVSSNHSSPSFHLVDNMTVFWCLRSVDGLCKDSINWVTIPARDRVAEVSLSVNYSSVMFGLAASSHSVSSGITWADCIHNINKPPSPPTSVHVSLSTYSDHGELHVTWLHSGCSVNNVGIGLARQFRLHYCQLNSSAQCLGDTLTIVNINSDYNSWNLTNLNHGESYTVWMTSVGSLGVESAESNNATAHTTISWATSGIITAITVCLIFILVFAACLLWRCCRWCSRYRRRFTGGVSINVPINSIKSPLSDEDNDVGYEHQTRLLGNNRNSDNLARPLMAPPSVTETPSPTCGCGQEDILILGYINLRHPVSEDGDAATLNDSQTYQTSNPSVISSYNGMSTPPKVLSILDGDNVPTAASVQTAPQAVAVVGSPADLPTAYIGNPGYIVVGPDTFNCTSMPNASIPVMAGNGNPDMFKLRDNGYSDVSVAVGQQLPDVCAVPSVLGTPKQQLRDSNIKWYDVSPAFSDKSGPDHTVQEPPEVLPLTQYAKIVGALERSTPPEDHLCMLDSYPARQPGVTNRINGMLTDPRCHANISSSNEAVSYTNGYVRHTDLFVPTAAVVDS